MNYIHKLRKLFFYAGLEREEYKELLPIIRDGNRVLLGVFSRIAAVMFFLLFIASMITRGFASVNIPTYFISGIIMIAILLCVYLFVPKHPALVMALVYVFEIVLYAFGIYISMLHADKPAVSAVAFLLVSPLLFYDRPSRLSFLLAVVVAVFCLIVIYFKQPEIAQTDIWNMITFGIVAVVVTIFIMSIKTRALAQSRQIEYMSQTDLLTGLKNRNHFEKQVLKYPKMCTSNLICIYGDVNGLHEINNRSGHQAGDRMLKDVAAAMQQVFGPDHTYRIGGDEFLAFQVDGKPEKVSWNVDRIGQELDKKGYHVSFGIAVQDKAQDTLDMHELVKAAEREMFIHKQVFYSQPEHNRRNR